MRDSMQGPGLGDILTAIREVEESLDRRANRVGGALMVMWGIIAALVAMFYQLVMLNPEPYEHVLGPFLPWAWVAPVSVGYAAGALVGARLLAATHETGHRRQTLLDFVPAVTSTAIAAALTLAGRFDLIPGALLAGFSVSLALRCRAAERASPEFLRAAYGASAVCAVAGVAFLALPVVWAWWVTGALFGGSLVLLGRMRMSAA